MRYWVPCRGHVSYCREVVSGQLDGIMLPALVGDLYKLKQK